MLAYIIPVLETCESEWLSSPNSCITMILYRCCSREAVVLSLILWPALRWRFAIGGAKWRGGHNVGEVDGGGVDLWNRI